MKGVFSYETSSSFGFGSGAVGDGVTLDTAAIQAGLKVKDILLVYIIFCVIFVKKLSKTC